MQEFTINKLPNESPMLTCEMGGIILEPESKDSVSKISSDSPFILL